MKSIFCLIFMVASMAFGQQARQTVAERMADYHRSPSEETAADLISSLIQAAMADRSSRPIADAPALDLNEGRRLALKLLANRQDGASAGIGGGSSLVSLKSVTDLISGAMESGALSKNTEGTITSFRANVIGSYHLLTGDCPADSILEYPSCVGEDLSPWRGLSVAFSFDSSRNDQIVTSNTTNPEQPASVLFLRARRGLSAAGLRYEFYKKRNTASKSLRGEWDKAVDSLHSVAKDYAKALGEGPEALTGKALDEADPKALHNLLKDLDERERLPAAQKFIDDILGRVEYQITAAKRAEYLARRREFLTKEVAVYRDLLDRKILTAEYTHQRPKDEPEYGSVRIIMSFAFGGNYTDESGATAPNWEATFNVGADFFYCSPAVQSGRNLRDFQAALQLNRRLWRWKFFNQPTFSIAGYYQRLTDDMVLQFNSDAIVPETNIPLPKPADVILKETKGDVGIVQAKLVIPIGSAGVSLPLAVSWSNRTEFLRTQGNDVRAHFGFLFDMDKLLSSLKK